MKKILIIADGITTAHPTRMEQLANQIDKKRFEVHFATTQNYFSLLTINKKFLYPITSISTKSFTDRIFNTQLPWTRTDLDSQLKEDRELLKQARPDIVIGDTRLTLTVACKEEGIPYYNVVNFHWTPLFQRPLVVPYIKQVESLGRSVVTKFAKWLTPVLQMKQKMFINSWLKSVKQPPVKSVYEFYCQGDHLLFPDIEENFKGSTIPENGTFIGPLIWKNNNVKWPEGWGKLDPAMRYALVSMGSSGETKHIPKVVKALNFLGYVVIYVGSISVFDKPEQYKMIYADFVPLDQVLDHCTLAVGNGGTGTTYFYLSKGVLSYYVPTNMDQYLSVTHLKSLGLTDYQDVDDFSEKVFIEKITALVNSSQVKKNSSVVKKSIEDDLQKNIINQILS
jgi:UDP:flavonoid glycosyltransferase YjiC (YdhE family)